MVWIEGEFEMRITQVYVKNFKGISGLDDDGNAKNAGKGEKVELSNVTIIVGPNSSGKSSLLQALHWASRCVAHDGVQRNQTRAISPLKLDYFPTTDIKRVGNTQDLRAQRGETLEVMAEVRFYAEDNDEQMKAVVPIRRGNNDTVQIAPDIPSETLYRHMKSQENPFTAYIPGLAGIPVSEEKQSRLPVFRRAASGDANVVLRNILDLIKSSNNKDTSIEMLSYWVTKVLGETKLWVEFIQDKDFHINAEFQTARMQINNRWAPLELAGTGVLQVVQIFSYLVLFRPKLLLIDEPDSHLHPDKQEALIRVLEEAAQEFKTQVVLTTHSHNVVRAKGPSTRLVWMKDGAVQTAEDRTIKRLMGWGGLDKKLLMFVEDQTQTDIIRLLSQWPHLASQVAVCSSGGVEKLPSADLLKGLIDGAALDMRVLVHRDRDFMTEEEVGKWSSPYKNARYGVWVTKFCDVEHYFTDPSHIARRYEVDEQEAERWLNEAFAAIGNNAYIKFTNKREELVRLGIADKQISEKLVKQWEPLGCRHVSLGKELRKKLRKIIIDKGLDQTKLDIVEINPADDATLAIDLRSAIELALQ
jgi:energy-coupling factor transporter ATP-binding protein EcfA2